MMRMVIPFNKQKMVGISLLGLHGLTEMVMRMSG